MCEKYMREALKEAEKAAGIDEIPVGAVIVRDGAVIARGHNETESRNDPTAHAEMIAIQRAAEITGFYRLTDCEMYVTLEPCAMCAGAIVQARIPKIYIGAMDPKAGACGSVYDILGEGRLNHRPDVTCGIMEEECGSIVSLFFKKIRGREKYKK